MIKVTLKYQSLFDVDAEKPIEKKGFVMRWRAIGQGTTLKSILHSYLVITKTGTTYDLSF